MALLVDSGALYALADRKDAWHARVRRFLEQRRELLLLPAPVLPEVSHLLRARLGGAHELALVRSIADGEISVHDLAAGDYRRCAELMSDYDQIGFVDASVVAVAERLNLPRILTTDRRHFSFVRPRHVSALTLLP